MLIDEYSINSGLASLRMSILPAYPLRAVQVTR